MLGMAPATSGEGGLGADTCGSASNGADIRALERRIETRFQAAQGDAFGTQWLDEGYWLLLPVALLALALVPARHDGGVGDRCSCRLHACAGERAGAAARFSRSVADAGPAGPDCVRPRRLPPPRKRFADPMWRGIAAYRASISWTAAQEFRKVETIEGRFALGNARGAEPRL